MIEWIESLISDDNIANAIMAFVAVAVFVQSILALIFKALSSFIKRVRNKVIMLPNEDGFFYFSSNGMVMKLFFTLVSQNIDTIVTDVKVILKNKDVTLNLKWDGFHSTYYESYGAGGGNKHLGKIDINMTKDIFSYPHPFYLKKKVTQLLNVSFLDVEKSKEINLIAGEYDLVFEIYSTEKKKPFKAKRNINLSSDDIQTLKQPKSSGKIVGANNSQPNYVKVGIETPPAIVYMLREVIKDKLRKGGKK